MKDHQRRKNKRLLIWLSAIGVGMFFFGYALVPLYNVMCKAWGLNGKSSLLADQSSTNIDKSRLITVQFLGNTNANLQWEFRPLTTTIAIHPGENATLSFYAKNLSDHTMTVQAIPSITPGLAAKHLKKTECFCFTQQTFQSHQAMQMPVIFHIDTELPKDINTITLSYTLFEAKKKVAANKQGRL
jgi:cytochrome c oxidase assembly protein subunit 11